MKATKKTKQVPQENRRLQLIITIEGYQGSGKSSAASIIQEALQLYREPYGTGKFKVAIFDTDKVPTAEQMKSRITQDGSNVVVIVKN